eukprot:GSMAST32.ASY1.ANO1.2181.1 assembled CDS
MSDKLSNLSWLTSRCVISVISVFVCICMIYTFMVDIEFERAEEVIEKRYSRRRHRHPKVLGDFVKIDMHSHTTESDADWTAEEVIAKAANHGLSTIWITDHDIIRSRSRTLEIFNYAEEFANIKVGFGVEMTVLWNSKEHHLLGYFPNSVWVSGNQYSNEMINLQSACEKIKQSRISRNSKLVDWLNDILYNKPEIYFTSTTDSHRFKNEIGPITIVNVAEWARDHAGLDSPLTLGRPHFKAYLVEVLKVREDVIFGPRHGSGWGIIDTNGSILWNNEDDTNKFSSGFAFEALLSSGTLQRRNIVFKPMPIIEAITLITKAGGKAVIAHITTLGSNWELKFAPSLSQLKKIGLWGIEAFSSEINENNNKRLVELAKQLGLEITGGSDSHGTLKPYATLGSVWHTSSIEPEQRYSGVQLWDIKNGHASGEEVSNSLI